MGYGDSYSDSVRPLKRQRVNITGITAAVRKPPTRKPGAAAPAINQRRQRKLKNEIRHPLSAIMANASAAQRWLNRPDPNFAEALAALDRIVRDGNRIDEMI